MATEGTEVEVKDPTALLAAYNRLKEDVKSLRAELVDSENALNGTKDELKALQDAGGDNEWRDKAILAEVRSTLAAQGVKDTDRLLKYIKTEGLDFDEHGKLTGLDDSLKELKVDFPQVFDAKRRVGGGTADIFADNATETRVDPLRDAVHNALSAKD